MQDQLANLVRVKVLDATGKPYSFNGRITFGALSAYSFREPLPTTARLRTHAATPQSLRRLPLELPPAVLPITSRQRRTAFMASLAGSDWIPDPLRGTIVPITTLRTHSLKSGGHPIWKCNNP